jgi:hypothetical protein
MQQFSHKTENTPSQALRPYLRNARRHRKARIKQIATLIERSVAESADYSSKPPPNGQGEDFQQIALLFTPNPPEWLNEYLEFLSCCVWREWVLEEEKPTRAELLHTLDEVKNAVEFLMKVLGRGDFLEFLFTEDRPLSLPKMLNFLMRLRDVYVLADDASHSPKLVGQDGKPRPGRGRAYPTNTLLARTYCALVIAVTWKHFNGNYPPPRNRRAAKAAEALWQVSLGTKSGIGGNDVLAAWRPHFRKAQSLEAGKRRTEFCDILRDREARFNQAKAGEGNQSS